MGIYDSQVHDKMNINALNLRSRSLYSTGVYSKILEA